MIKCNKNNKRTNSKLQLLLELKIKVMKKEKFGYIDFGGGTLELMNF